MPGAFSYQAIFRWFLLVRPSPKRGTFGPQGLTAYGNPWYRLLRHEVESLVRDKSGLDHLTKKKLQKELADLNTEARKLTTRMKAIERRRAELMKELDG